MKEFTCKKCGYEATKKAKLYHCPLCLVCKHCKKTVRHCSCSHKE